MTSAPVSSETADNYTNDNDNKAVAPVTASAAPASEDHNITPPTAPAAIQPDELPQPDVDLAEIPDVTEAEDETASAVNLVVNTPSGRRRSAPHFKRTLRSHPELSHFRFPSIDLLENVRSALTMWIWRNRKRTRNDSHRH